MADRPESGNGAGVVLGPRELNRALLERQWLLRRVDRSIPQALSHLVGLQAQATPPPYYGLLARLRGFDPDQLSRMLEQREAVRMTLMRGTVHLALPADDAAWLRPLVQVVIERGHNGTFGRRMGGADTAALGRMATEELLGEGPLAVRDLGRRLVERGIGDDAEAIGNAIRVYAPPVQVPPRGVWGKGGRAIYMPFEQWTGAKLDPAPVRFLGEYDNVLLGHADRTRIIPADFPWKQMLAANRFVNNLLVDGALRATWWIERDGKRLATLAIRPWGKLAQAEREEVEAEAEALIKFAGQEAAARAVRFEPAVP